MNQTLGLIGRKLGMTQVFAEDGSIERVTAVEAGPCVVVCKRTLDKDRYSALQLGFGERPERTLNHPEVKYFEKQGVKPVRVLRELRLPEDIVAKYEVGQQLNVGDVFAPGQFVDVIGRSRGRGFKGVMVRWNFKGSNMSHGTHEYRRHGGSIGQNMTPGRTWPNKGMPGHHGDARVTAQALRIVRVLADENVLLIHGPVPGARNGTVIVRGTVKVRHKREVKQTSTRGKTN